MDHNLNGMHGSGIVGSWTGLGVTLLLGIISQITLNDFVLICTGLAALSTFGYNVHKWRQSRRELRNKK